MPPTTKTDPTSINVAICEALGLEPNRIRKNGVTITLDQHLGPVITVEYQTLDRDHSLLLAGLKRYKLVPIDE